MCNIVPGQLLVCFPKVNQVARELWSQLSSRAGDTIESLAELVKHWDGLWDGMKFEYYKLLVPEGEEVWHMARLYDDYHQLLAKDTPPSDARFIVSTNHWLSPLGRGGTGKKAADFSFDTTIYPVYRNIMQVPATSPSVSGIKIAILDSGVAADITSSPYNVPIVGHYNLANPQQPNTTDDITGHGTVVARLIADVAPNAEISMYKIYNDQVCGSEWEVLAAISMCHQSHIVNMSFESNLDYAVPCGHRPSSTRSRIFETMLDEFVQPGDDGPIFVAAAGNVYKNNRTSSGPRLDTISYPARFSRTFAIGSINSQQTRSAFSRYGLDHNGNPHAKFFVLPGGDDDASTPESIGAWAGQRSDIYGTSYAAACASGIIAQVLAQHPNCSKDHDALLNELKNRAKVSYAGYRSIEHGNGIMRL